MSTVVRVLPFVLLCSAALAAVEPTAPDSTAPHTSARLLEALGGRPAWAEARSIRVVLRGYYAREHRPWTETFWLDLEAPRGRFELRDGDVDRTIAWTPNGGWEERDGTVEPMPEARHAVEMAYWRRQPFVLFHQLAQGKVDLRLAAGDDDSTLRAIDLATGETLARFAVNLAGEPTKWLARIGDHEIEHLLGPLEPYGQIRFPRWGGSVDGVWRFDHISIELGSAPFDAPLQPPSVPTTDE